MSEKRGKEGLEDAKNKTKKIIKKRIKILQEIVKNDEEYKILLERKKAGEPVEDLIKQNRYQAEILKKKDKENSEKAKKWGQSEEAKNLFEKMNKWLRMNPDLARTSKIRLKYGLKIAKLGDEIKKNEEEYEKLVERKNKGEYIDDLIKQNRYAAEILAKEKKNYEESMKEFEAEKKRIEKEGPEWPMLPEANHMTLENLGEEIFFFYDNYKNIAMLQIEHLESLMQKTTDESRKNILIKKVFELKYELNITSHAIVYFSVKKKPYDVNFLSKGQEKEAQKIIDLVVNGLKLKKIPNHKVFGRKLAEGEKKDNHFYERDIKLVFNLKNHLKKLIYILQIRPTQKFYTEQILWTGILDFPIPQAFLFGRVAKQMQHGGGTYCFVPFNHEIINIGSFKEDWEKMLRIMEKYIKTEMVKDFISEEIKEFNYLYDSIENTIENYYVIASLNQFCFSSNAITFMKEGYYKFKSKKASCSHFIHQLNDDLKLIKLLKKISHFGNSYMYSYKIISDCDVSIFFFPYLSKTIFQVCDFKSQNKNTIPAIKALIGKIYEVLY